MKLAKIFIVFNFLLASVLSVSAQEKIDPNITKQVFDSLLEERKIEDLRLGDSSPNELAGYEFFKSGKLKGLKLGISTKKDVEKIFGTSCERVCDYDSDWKIQFEYFSRETVLIKDSDKKNKLKVKTSPRSADNFQKLRAVKLTPKKTISRAELLFSEEFYFEFKVGIGDNFSGSSTQYLTFSFTDGYGLKYLFARDGNTDTNNLILINYRIPKDLEEKMFVEQK